MGTYEYTETTGDPRLLALAFFSILKDFLWDRTRLVFFGLMSFLGLAAVVVAGVYFADVRPKVRAEAPAYRTKRK